MKITIVQAVHYPQGWVNEKSSFYMDDEELLTSLKKKEPEIILRKQNRYEDIREVIHAMMCENVLRPENYVGNLKTEAEEIK